MSSTYSLVSADFQLALRLQGDSEPLPSVRLTDIAAPSFKRIGEWRRGLEMPGDSPETSSQASSQSTLFAPDSLAKTLASPTSKALEQRVQERDFTEKRSGLLTSWSQDCSWKTCQGSLLAGSETFSGPWPESGSMQSGLVYQHETPAPITSENDSGSWPTPGARDGKDLSTTTAYLASRERHSPSLATELLGRGVPWWAVSTFYEAAMGFPLQWSAAVYMGSAMRYRRRSRKRLAKQSSRDFHPDD